VANQAGEGREAFFSVKANCVGGGKLVGDPLVDLPSENRHWVHNGRRGGPGCRPIQEDWRQKRTS